jgi:hypothetical protein
MAVDIVMPQMGESIFEGTITKWLKKPGDKVERDEPLFEISTDKGDQVRRRPDRAHSDRRRRDRCGWLSGSSGGKRADGCSGKDRGAREACIHRLCAAACAEAIGPRPCRCGVNARRRGSSSGGTAHREFHGQ